MPLSRPRLPKRSGLNGQAKNAQASSAKMYQLMVENAEDLGAILTAEMGKPLAEGIGEVNYSASFFEWFGEEAKRIYGETIPGHMRGQTYYCAETTDWCRYRDYTMEFPICNDRTQVGTCIGGWLFVCWTTSKSKRRCLHWRFASLPNAQACQRGLLSIITSSRAQRHRVGILSKPKCS